jgi:hypothetical protein
MVTRFGRPARSTRDLLNILDVIAKSGAGFKSLADLLRFVFFRFTLSSDHAALV